MLSTTTPPGWLAFELSILYRFRFASVAIPLMGDPAIGGYLKRRNVRVASNDILQSDWQRSIGVVQNTAEKLGERDVELILEDAYIPGYKLANDALRNRFSEVDSWWFDNVRRNIDRLDSPFKRALAASLVFAVGDYVASFSEETRELRQPLSATFRRLLSIMPEPVSGGSGHVCHNKTPDAFVAETFGDVLFLRLPKAEIGGNGSRPWHEEWLRGNAGFWAEFEASTAGKLGRPVETRSQYVRLVDDLLNRASNIKQWVITHTDTGVISAQDIAQIIGKHRAVETIFTKDFSELTGKKAVIIAA